jgi:hypothetical protein
MFFSFSVRSGRLKQLANVVLLVIMLGAVYTHYVLRDKFERMAPGLVFSLLLITRLIIHRQVKQREQGQSSGKDKKVKKPEIAEEDDEQEEEGEETRQSGDEKSTSEQEDKQTSSADKKNKKKKNK